MIRAGSAVPSVGSSEVLEVYSKLPLWVSLASLVCSGLTGGSKHLGCMRLSAALQHLLLCEAWGSLNVFFPGVVSRSLGQ